MEDFNKYTSHINYSPLVDFALQQGKQVLYKKGECFVRQGEICRTMGFVVSGSFRYCCTNSTGESSIVGYTFDGSFVGNYPAFQLEDQSNVDIQALCDSSVYMVTHQQLADFYETNNGKGEITWHLGGVSDSIEKEFEKAAGEAIEKHSHVLGNWYLGGRDVLGEDVVKTTAVECINCGEKKE